MTVQPDFLGALAPRNLPQQDPTIHDALGQLAPGEAQSSQVMTGRKISPFNILSAVAVAGGGFLLYRHLKKSRGSGARVRVVETGEVVEVDPNSIEITQFEGDEGQFEGLTVQMNGQDVLVEMEDVQDDPHPDAAQQTARRMMGRAYSSDPVGSGNQFPSLHTSMMGMNPHTTAHQEEHFDELVQKAYDDGDDQVEQYFQEVGF